MTRAREQKKELSVVFIRRVVVDRYTSRPLSVATSATTPEVKRLIEKMIDQECVGRMGNLYSVEAGTDGDVASQCEERVDYEVVTDEVTAKVYPVQDEITRPFYTWHVIRDMDGVWRLVNK